MSQYIPMSQLIGLISASHETNKIQIKDGDLAWRCGKIDEVHIGEHSLSIKWDRGSGYGSQDPHLCLSLVRMEKGHFNNKYFFTAYYYYGDNCNDRTRFLYKIMADEIEILDDLGIVGHGGEIGKTYLTKLKWSDYSRICVNANGREITFANGHWDYKNNCI